MGDEKAVERALQRRPGPHAGGGAGARQIDRRAAAEIVTPRHRPGSAVSCVPQPSSAGWQPSPTKPSIDQVLTNSPGCLGDVGDLRVALGDVDDLDAEVAAPGSPSSARSVGAAVSTPGVAGDVQQRLLDEMRDQARDWRHASAPRSARSGRPQRQRGFPQRVVGALRGVSDEIGIAAGPGLDAGIEIERAESRGRVRSARPRKHRPRG